MTQGDPNPATVDRFYSERWARGGRDVFDKKFYSSKVFEEACLKGTKAIVRELIATKKNPKKTGLVATQVFINVHKCSHQCICY